MIPLTSTVECAICLKSLNPEEKTSGHRIFSMQDEREVVISHLFHKTCLIQAFENTGTGKFNCPFCRKKFLTPVEQSQLVEEVERGNSSKVNSLLRDYIFTCSTLENAFMAALRSHSNECLQALRDSRLYSQATLKRLESEYENRGKREPDYASESTREENSFSFCSIL